MTETPPSPAARRKFLPAERLLLAASKTLNRMQRHVVPISNKVKDSYDLTAMIDRYFRNAHGANPQSFYDALDGLGE